MLNYQAVSLEYKITAAQQVEQREILYGLTYMWNFKKLNSETENIMLRAEGWGEWGNVDQRVRTSSYKVNNFWRWTVQRDNCSEQHRIVYLKVAESTS